jgi:hypothetical protein
MAMRKMMSIVFLLLVLIISLGVSVYMESTKVVNEGMENEEEMPTEEMPTEEMPAEEMPAEEMPAEEMPAEENASTEVSGEDSTFDVSPMEGSCTETMTNYN